jgi:protoheme IX farnesyltransferase
MKVTYNPSGSLFRLRMNFRSEYGRLVLLTFGVLVILMTSGTLVAKMSPGHICRGWPLCNNIILPIDPGDWVNLFHRGMVFLGGILITSTFWQAWHRQRSRTAVIVTATTIGVLYWSQALLGMQMVGEVPIYLLVVHQISVLAIWVTAAILVVVVGISPVQSEDAAVFTRRKIICQFKDLFMLTKPIVVALLLVTTLAGMVIGAKAWPPFRTVIWTLVGGFFAAGGSSAINQYIDRRDDEKMQRTRKRPIPAGRLTPGEGLAFGVGLALASFYIFIALVNFLAAILSLAGIIYYVLLYSVFLKKSTVQNIVIGGGAGAIPPLVGWVAATGSLNFPALFLFAIIFVWTPPHFWALALVRRNDYARAGVPMLPVVRGEYETRWQIFLYTIALVGLTLFLPLFDLGGVIYLAGAVLLGGWLLIAAWRVWKTDGNKNAWKMYRYSSMYLAFLFCVLMVDRLIS